MLLPAYEDRENKQRGQTDGRLIVIASPDIVVVVVVINSK